MTDTAIAPTITLTESGEPFPYRPGHWDNYTFSTLTVTPLFKAIYREAYLEHDRRTAQETAPAIDSTPSSSPVEPPAEDRTALGQALATTRKLNTELEAQLAILREANRVQTARINSLMSDQIDASDERLTDFWEKAHQAASNAGHCSVFDDLCEELGGPGRSRDFRVRTHVTFEVFVNVTARDEDDAISQVDDMHHSDLIEQVDLTELGYSDIESHDAREADAS